MKRVGKLFESCNGYLVRAIPHGRKFDAQIKGPGSFNIIEYGGWDTEAEALQWAREEARYALRKIPPLFWCQVPAPVISQKE